MCMGGAPRAPKIVYQGPSKAELAAQAQGLEQYKDQMRLQQDALAGQLQQQIDEANLQSQVLKQKYDAEAAAAIAAGNAQQVGAYAAAATQSEAPATAQTTAAVVKKEKPKSLKITTAALPATAGTGLNIGV